MARSLVFGGTSTYVTSMGIEGHLTLTVTLPLRMLGPSPKWAAKEL